MGGRAEVSDPNGAVDVLLTAVHGKRLLWPCLRVKIISDIQTI